MAKMTKPKSVKRKKRKYIPQVPYTRKPEGMSVLEWQTSLRKQIAEKSTFKILNIGEENVFSDYQVHNTGTRNTYKVALRSIDNSLNYCSCYDFKTNQLGTCKHIEGVLISLRKKPVLRKALKEPYTTTYSSMFMEYRGERKIMFRPGTENQKQ